GSGSGAQPFKTVQDHENWLARAGRLPVLMDTAIANMRAGMEAGVVQPRVLMEKVVPQLDSLIKDAPEDTLFWGPVGAMPEGFSDAAPERRTAAYHALTADELMPAYRELRDFIADEYLPATRETVSLAALPDGEAWYAFNAAQSTTTDLTPAQIHQVGLDEVARIHGEIEQVMAQVGFDGTMREFFEFMKTDPQFA